MSRLFEIYAKEIVPKLISQFGYTNIHTVPRLVKVVVNVGVGEAIQNVKLLDEAAAELGQITGQKPVINRAKKSIAGFKLRTGMPIGCSVTLRGARMYEFCDRLMNASLPRVRDFRGISDRAFDGRGNFTLGIQEQIIFPEIDYDKVSRLHGLSITIVTSAKHDDEARALLAYLGMPFKTAQ
ncbi:MAG: 50S ribosomal protein L5 [Candidatus Coatesbacteria bacterium]|nr:50S ribosomal protein L5 [Candidatus Coatesbacteria bacterium]